MLAEGPYRGTIVEAYLGYTFGGDPAACLVVGVRDTAGQPHKLEWQGGLDGSKWLAITVRSLRAAGWVGDDLATIETLLRKSVDVEVHHKTSKNGKVYVTVRIQPKKRMDPAVAAGYAAQMRRMIASVGQPEEESVSTEPVAEDSPPINLPDPDDFTPPSAVVAGVVHPVDDDDDVCPF